MVSVRSVPSSTMDGVATMGPISEGCGKALLSFSFVSATIPMTSAKPAMYAVSGAVSVIVPLAEVHAGSGPISTDSTGVAPTPGSDSGFTKNPRVEAPASLPLEFATVYGTSTVPGTRPSATSPRLTVRFGCAEGTTVTVTSGNVVRFENNPVAASYAV